MPRGLATCNLKTVSFANKNQATGVSSQIKLQLGHLVSYHEKVGAVDAVVKDGADDGGPDDQDVLELVDPALVDDGDDLDDVGTVDGPEDHELEALGGLDDAEDDRIGEWAEEGDGQGSQVDGQHDQVTEDRQEGRDVRVNLGTLHCTALCGSR